MFLHRCILDWAWNICSLSKLVFLPLQRALTREEKNLSFYLHLFLFKACKSHWKKGECVCYWAIKTLGRIIKANLSWSRTRAKFCQLKCKFIYDSYSNLNWQSSDLRALSLNSSAKKKDMNTDKLAINWQDFARV